MIDRPSNDLDVSTDIAVASYLVPVLGWLFILLFRKKNPFAVYHARQAVLLTIVAVGAPIVWAVVAWIVAQFPFGGLLAAFLFSLVIAVYFGVIIAWLGGIVHALKAEYRPIPIFGGWVRRWL